MAISVVRIALLFFNNSVIIIHFGRKPVSGGSPPRDRSVVGKINSIDGILFHTSDVKLIDVRESIINRINIEEVRKT